jgi:hypothetical protein
MSISQLHRWPAISDVVLDAHAFPRTRSRQYLLLPRPCLQQCLPRPLTYASVADLVRAWHQQQSSHSFAKQDSSYDTDSKLASSAVIVSTSLIIRLTDPATMKNRLPVAALVDPFSTPARNKIVQKYYTLWIASITINQQQHKQRIHIYLPASNLHIADSLPYKSS